MPSHQPATAVGPTDAIDPAALVGPGSLATFEQLAEADSTMDRARAVASASDAALPFAVVADRQRRGRGRRAASWWQPAGALAVSVVVAARNAPAGPPPSWSLAAGVALAETIRLLEPTVAALVRWPNDVEVAGRKLAGILVETVGGRTIFGIGVNTTGSATEAPPRLARRVATLPDLVGRPLGRQRLLAEFLPRLFAVLADVTSDERFLADRYRPLCALVGRPIRVHVAKRIHDGICGGIAADGRLILDTPTGQLLIVSGSLTPPEDVWLGEA